LYTAGVGYQDDLRHSTCKMKIQVPNMLHLLIQELRTKIPFMPLLFLHSTFLQAYLAGASSGFLVTCKQLYSELCNLNS